MYCSKINTPYTHLICFCYAFDLRAWYYSEIAHSNRRTSLNSNSMNPAHVCVCVCLCVYDGIDKIERQLEIYSSHNVRRIILYFPLLSVCAGTQNANRYLHARRTTLIIFRKCIRWVCVLCMRQWMEKIENKMLKWIARCLMGNGVVVLKAWMVRLRFLFIRRRAAIRIQIMHSETLATISCVYVLCDDCRLFSFLYARKPNLILDQSHWLTSFYRTNNQIFIHFFLQPINIYAAELSICLFVCWH